MNSKHLASSEDDDGACNDKRWGDDALAWWPGARARSLARSLDLLVDHMD
jgi:hypothetical protein